MNGVTLDLIKILGGAIFALAGAVMLALKIMDRRISKGSCGENSLSIPVKYKAGHGDKCDYHTTAIAKLQESQKNLVETVVPEIKKHVTENFDKIFDLIRELNSGRRS